MPNYAKATIIGHLGRDPEMRELAGGKKVCSFTVAVNNRRGKDGAETTTWFRVTAWREQAENCQKYLTKGSQVFVDGRLKQEEYTDKSGVQRTSLEIDASDVQFLTPREAGQAAGGYKPYEKYTPDTGDF